MSAEWLAALATLGTFVVIAASAAAALIQLRHMRNSNQLAVFGDFQEHFESDEFRKALRLATIEVPGHMNDPEFRRDLLRNDSAKWLMLRELLNYLDYTGALVKHNMADRDLACDLFYAPVVRTWDALGPLIASRRAMLGYRLWEDFEYLYLECVRFRRRHPEGTFPKKFAPAKLPQPWPEASEEHKTV